MPVHVADGEVMSCGAGVVRARERQARPDSAAGASIIQLVEYAIQAQTGLGEATG